MTLMQIFQSIQSLGSWSFLGVAAIVIFVGLLVWIVLNALSKLHVLIDI